MARNEEDIRDLVERELPGVYERIGRGDTKDQCQDFSEAILKVLLENGEDVIMVQSRTREGEPLHHFLLWREDGIGDPVLIDPTISQLYSGYNDIFIGSREELREMIFNDEYGSLEHEEDAREIFKEYWRKTLHLYEPDELYEDLKMKKPSKMDKAEFQEKWNENNEFKVIQREKHISDLGSRRSERYEGRY